MKSGQEIAIARRSLAPLAHACRAMCASCDWLRRLANASSLVKLGERRRLGSDGLPNPIPTICRRTRLEEGQGVITECWNVSQPLIGHLYDALGQYRLRRERLGCLREVAAKTLQERPRLIERIANRACLAKIKRQRIFNHHANSSRPTC